MMKFDAPLLDSTQKDLTALSIRYHQVIPLLESLGHANLVKDLEEGLALMDHCLVHLHTVGHAARELLAMPLEIDVADEKVRAAAQQAACTRTLFNSMMFFGAHLQEQRTYAELVWMDHAAWTICLKPTAQLSPDNLPALFGPHIKPEDPNAPSAPWLPVHIYWEVGRPRKMCWIPDLIATNARIPVVPSLPFVNLLHGPVEPASMEDTL